MKNILYLPLACAVLFTACSKSNDPAHPVVPANLVTISGASYTTVVIGSQTWTSVNYNGPGGENYNNGANDPAYGKLYTFAEAQAIALPSGWRLPTAADFNNLLAAIGDEDLGGVYFSIDGQPLELMAETDWTSTNGNDKLGFNALPAGLYNQVTEGNQQFNGLGTTALFMSSTLYFTNGTFPDTMVIGVSGADLTDLVVLPTDRASLRFVKDN